MRTSKDRLNSKGLKLKVKMRLDTSRCNEISRLKRNKPKTTKLWKTHRSSKPLNTRRRAMIYKMKQRKLLSIEILGTKTMWPRQPTQPNRRTWKGIQPLTSLRQIQITSNTLRPSKEIPLTITWRQKSIPCKRFSSQILRWKLLNMLLKSTKRNLVLDRIELRLQTRLRSARQSSIFNFKRREWGIMLKKIHIQMN